jgi:NADH:ubiquinone oxidoreductase subunit 6 (subunit J)
MRTKTTHGSGSLWLPLKKLFLPTFRGGGHNAFFEFVDHLKPALLKCYFTALKRTAMTTTNKQKTSFLTKLQNLLKIGPSYGPNIFNSSPVEALILLSVALPVLFVVLVAVLHSATLLVYVVGPLLHRVLIPVASILFVLAVPVLKNPVHSLLCLLALFASMAITFLGAGAEYLALVFLIVYVGGLAILFLFVVMLLNPNDITKSQQGLTYNNLSYIAAAAVGVLTYIKVTRDVLTGLEQHFTGPIDAPTELELFGAQVRTDILALSELYDEQ